MAKNYHEALCKNVEIRNVKYILFLVSAQAPFSLLSPSPAGPVIHRGPYSAAHIHPAPDEETGKAREEAREGGGVGGGDICSVGRDATELW